MLTLNQAIKKVLDTINQKRNEPLIYFLYGDLGVGKTHFVKQIAQKLGIQDTIISPTFVILQDYDIPNDTRKLVHIDFYRFKDNISEQLLEEIAFYDYILNDIVFIEWANLIEPILSPDLLSNLYKIKIKKDVYGHRLYEFI